MADGDSLNDFVKAQREAIEDRFERQVDALAAVAGEFGLNEVKRHLTGQLKRLRAQRFEIMVAGRFKVGKSTFLNALLTSAGREFGLDGDQGPLPVDTLPCTAVLTRIEYAPSPFVRARYFDGRQEDWTFQRYLDEARLYGETVGEDGQAKGSALERVASFDLGLPVELLRRGLVFVDSPGISEDPRRTAITSAALHDVHAGVIMLRSDALAGEDEIDFALDVVRRTGHAFPVVNMFHDDRETDRFLNVLNHRTARLRDESDLNKLEASTFLVNCRAAFEGYKRNDAAMVRASGIRKLEARLAEFLVQGAYYAKARGSIDGVTGLVKVIREELARLKVALSAEREEFQARLESCASDLEEIVNRRNRVEAILDRTIRMATSEAADSYRHMCSELEASVEHRFSQRPIPSLATTGGKLKSMVSKKTAREAAEILNELVSEHVAQWAEAPASKRGLQRDMMPALEDGRRDLDEQYKGIDAALQSINVKIASLDLDEKKLPPTIALGERWGSALGGLLLFGPIGGALTAATGWRGAVGGTIAVIAAKSALILAAGAFGFFFAPVTIAGLLVVALVGGSLTGGLIRLEERVREKALKAVAPRLREMAHDETALAEFKAHLAGQFGKEAAKVMAALDVVLEQQRESLGGLQEASEQSLEKKEARLVEVDEAEDTLTAVQAALDELVVMAAGAAPAGDQ